jgi:hypothetical protein
VGIGGVGLDPNFNPMVVTGVQWTRTAQSITQISVTFSKPLFTSTAINPANFALVEVGRNGKYSALTDPPVAMSEAVDQSSPLTVELTASQPLLANRFFHLSINGGTPGGLEDLLRSSSRKARHPSKAENTAADQVREPLPLFLSQKRVHFLKSAGERVTQPRRALDAALTGARDLGGVKCLPGDRVGKLRQGSPVIHFRLSPLGLDVVKNPDQRRNLLLVEIELVREEPQRASDPEA